MGEVFASVASRMTVAAPTGLPSGDWGAPSSIAPTLDATRSDEASSLVSGPVVRMTRMATACAASEDASDCAPSGIAMRSEPQPVMSKSRRLSSRCCSVGTWPQSILPSILLPSSADVARTTGEVTNDVGVPSSADGFA